MGNLGEADHRNLHASGRWGWMKMGLEKCKRLVEYR